MTMYICLVGYFVFAVFSRRYTKNILLIKVNLIAQVSIMNKNVQSNLTIAQ